jgi:hypothetical protein
MKFKGFVSLAAAMVFVSPFASAGDPVQMWKCSVNGDVNEEDVMEQAGKWKKAAGALDGGDGMSVYTMFPVSVGADGDGTDVLLAVSWNPLVTLVSGGMPTHLQMLLKWNAKP